MYLTSAVYAEKREENSSIMTKTTLCRRMIASGGYRSQRLDQMNLELRHWAAVREAATTVTEREFCCSMIEMYLKRYIWYLR